jgi:hypothetical protein
MRSINVPPPTQRWAERLTCNTPSCSNVTRERKPYCTEHIDRLDYVRGLLDTLSAVEDELELVRRTGVKAVDTCGVVAGEILRELRQHGDRTARRLSRDLKLDSDIVSAYLRALALFGAVVLRPGNRGRVVASALRIAS